MYYETLTWLKPNMVVPGTTVLTVRNSVHNLLRQTEETIRVNRLITPLAMAGAVVDANTQWVRMVEGTAVNQPNFFGSKEVAECVADAYLMEGLTYPWESKDSNKIVEAFKMVMDKLRMDVVTVSDPTVSVALTKPNNNSIVSITEMNPIIG